MGTTSKKGSADSYSWITTSWTPPCEACDVTYAQHRLTLCRGVSPEGIVTTYTKSNEDYEFCTKLSIKPPRDYQNCAEACWPPPSPPSPSARLSSGECGALEMETAEGGCIFNAIGTVTCGAMALFFLLSCIWLWRQCIENREEIREENRESVSAERHVNVYSERINIYFHPTQT
jgi:hypothetical protein